MLDADPDRTDVELRVMGLLFKERLIDLMACVEAGKIVWIKGFFFVVGF